MDEHYCTPDGFNWEHGVTQDLPNGDGPPPIVINPPSWLTESNALERARVFVTEAKRRSQVYKTNNILVSGKEEKRKSGKWKRGKRKSQQKYISK